MSRSQYIGVLCEKPKVMPAGGEPIFVEVREVLVLTRGQAELLALWKAWRAADTAEHDAIVGRWPAASL